MADAAQRFVNLALAPSPTNQLLDRALESRSRSREQPRSQHNFNLLGGHIAGSGVALKLIIVSRSSTGCLCSIAQR